MKLSIIPNVYQAAYMQGLAKKNNSGGRGKFNIFDKANIQKQIKYAYQLGVAESRPYTIDVHKNGNEFEGSVFALRNQDETAIKLKQIGVAKFPTGSVTISGKINKSPVDVTQQNVSGFLRNVDSRRLTSKKDGTKYVIGYKKIDYPPIEINKKDLFGDFK